MKSTSSVMPSSLTLRRISSAEWHEKNPGKTSYTGMCQLETSTDQRYIPTRDIYRPDTHHPKKEHTISRNRDSFAISQTVVKNMASHIYPRFSGWRPMRVCHHPKMGGMKNTQKTWDNGYKKPGDRWRKGQKN